MANGPSLAGAVSAAPRDRPRDHELDLYGLTHPGLVRQENQDQFLLATMHPQVVIHGTSLPDPGRLPARGQRVATLLLVADGVGGGTDGGQASLLAVEAIMRYVSSTMRCCHAAMAGSEEELFASLVEAAGEAHSAVRAEAADRQQGVMATTLTLAVAVWPVAYVVQVGDSRCYFFSKGKLQQVTRDQTVAQDLVDAGLMPAERASSSPYRHVLARAIGADEATPEVHRLDISERGCVLLLCSDGLTKHVADEEIAGHVRMMQSSEQLCRSLVELALARGGTDNVTVIAGRAVGG